MRRRFGLLAMLILLLVCRAATQSNPPEQVPVSPDISQGLLIYEVQPIYPPLARQARVQGTVVLQAVIDKDGSIKDLTVTSGHPMLIQAALDAVKQWRYKPYLPQRGASLGGDHDEREFRVEQRLVGREQHRRQ